MTAAELLMRTGEYAPLWIAKVPVENAKTITNAFRRRGGKGGRAVIEIGAEHLHISNVDCLSRKQVNEGCRDWPVRQRTAGEIASALRDPELGVTRGIRWLGDWKEPPPEPAGQEFVIPFFGEDRERFAFMFGLDARLLRGRGNGVDEDLMQRIKGGVNWWKVTMQGKPFDPSLGWAEPLR